MTRPPTPPPGLPTLYGAPPPPGKYSSADCDPSSHTPARPPHSLQGASGIDARFLNQK